MERTAVTRRSLPANQPANKELVIKLKSKTQQLRMSKLQTKSKLNQINRKLNEREKSINKVFKQSKKDQKLAIGSANTTRDLQADLKASQNIKKQRENELQEIINGDRYWIVGELRSEILVLHNENERLTQYSQNQAQQKHDLAVKLAHIRKNLRISRVNRQEITSLIEENKVLKDKCNSYLKGKQKLSGNDVLLKVSEKYEIYEEEKSKLEDEVKKLQEEFDNIVDETTKCDQEGEQSVQELDNVIEDLITKIQNAMNSKNEGEEKSNENSDNAVEEQSDQPNNEEIVTEEAKNDNENGQAEARSSEEFQSSNFESTS